MGSNANTRSNRYLLFASLSALSGRVLHKETLHKDLSEIKLLCSGPRENRHVKMRDKEGKRAITGVSSSKAPGEELCLSPVGELWKQSKSHLRVVPSWAEAGVFTSLHLSVIG